MTMLGIIKRNFVPFCSETLVVWNCWFNDIRPHWSRGVTWPRPLSDYWSIIGVYRWTNNFLLLTLSKSLVRSHLEYAKRLFSACDVMMTVTVCNKQQHTNSERQTNLISTSPLPSTNIMLEVRLLQLLPLSARVSGGYDNIRQIREPLRMWNGNLDVKTHFHLSVSLSVWINLRFTKHQQPQSDAC